MNVVIVGATGMVGAALVKECLESPDVNSMAVVVGSEPSGIIHEKSRDFLLNDATDFSDLEALTACDACFYCSTIASAVIKSETYARINFERPAAAARALMKVNPGMTFIAVSGAGTENALGRQKWAAMENSVLKVGFARAFVFRPGLLEAIPRPYVRTGFQKPSRPLPSGQFATNDFSGVYRLLHRAMWSMFPVVFDSVWKRIFPAFVTSSERVALAMLQVARSGHPTTLLECRDINALCERH